MALPKIDHPIYEVNLTSYKKPIKFRPFLVKEQKLLFMAAESGDYEEVVETMKQIINNCVITENFDVDNLPMVDIELMFLNLRARSVGENIEMFFKCTNEVEGSACGMVINVEIDILKEVAAGISNMDPVIMITDEVGVRMRYPTLDDMVYVKDSESFGNGSVELMARCIQQIFDGEQSFLTEEASLEELLEFIEDIPSNVYEKMQTFIQEMPKIKYEKEHECPKCKFQHFLKLEGMNDFFI